MMRVSHIGAAGLLTLVLTACSRDAVTSTPLQASGSPAARSPLETPSGGGITTGASASNPLGAPQFSGQNSDWADVEASPWNRLRPQAIVPITAVVFHVVAHADDWELFMNPNVYNEVNQQNTKNVLIYTTAGDAGAGSGPDQQRPYFVAREDGANRALRFVANVTPGFSSDTVTTQAQIRGHSIRKVTYKNTVSYFLRLSDGAPNGSGYIGESLQLMYQGKIKSMMAVDQSTTYWGWDDLKNTVGSIVAAEASPVGRASFNLMDPVATVNPDDHSDHLHTSLLVQDSLKNKPCVSINYFQTYNTSWQAINVSTNDLVNQAAVFGISESGKGDSGYTGSWEAYHKTWLGKNYFRTVPASSSDTCL